MAGYSLSARADTDLAGIYEYTIENHNQGLARAYLAGLHTRLSMLAEHPLQGRSEDALLPGLRRADYESHVVFYLVNDQGIHVVRVLHQRMDVPRHF